MEKYWIDRYDSCNEELLNKSFQVGWLKGSLIELQRILAEKKIKTDEYTLSRLNKIAQAFDESEQAAKRHSEEVRARLEANKNEAFSELVS